MEKQSFSVNQFNHYLIGIQHRIVIGDRQWVLEREFITFAIVKVSLLDNRVLLLKKTCIINE